MPAGLILNLAHWRDPHIPIPTRKPDADAALAWVQALPEDLKAVVLAPSALTGLQGDTDGVRAAVAARKGARKAAGNAAYKAVKAEAAGKAKSKAARKAVREAARAAASAAGNAADPGTAAAREAAKVAKVAAKAARHQPSAFKTLARAGDKAVRRMLLRIGTEHGLTTRGGGYLVCEVGANAVLGRIARDIGLLALAAAHCQSQRVLRGPAVVSDHLAGDVFEAALAAIQSEFGYDDDALEWFKSLVLPWVEQAIAAYKGLPPAAS